MEKFKKKPCDTNNIIWFEDGGTDQKTGCRVKDVEILFESGEDGQD